MSECTCGWTKGMRSVCICPKQPANDPTVVPMAVPAITTGPRTITLAEPPAEPMVVVADESEQWRDVEQRMSKAKAKVTPVTKPRAPKKPAKPALPKKKK